MTQIIKSISSIASNYDAIVFDQWGVLHDGNAPYEGAIDCLFNLSKCNLKLAVISNSGKRSEPNEKRIASMGFDTSLFKSIITSGEALWQDIANGVITKKHFFPIERKANDAKVWAEGLNILFEDSIYSSQAILLMGFPDGDSLEDWEETLVQALKLKIPLYCSNPDLLSPRPGGKLITAAGALAHYYRKCGGEVTFYGKPHKQIFLSLENTLKVGRLLMVGDSLQHDILGGHKVGWDTLLVQTGIHSAEFAHGDQAIILKSMIKQKKCEPPTFLIERVK